MITPIYLDSPCYCSDRRYGRHWPSRDSLASCDPRLPFVFIQVFYDLSFDNQTFARNVAIRYVILLIFAMDVYRLPQIYMKHRGALHQNILMPVCALSATENLAAVSIGRIIISAFSTIRMPSIIFYVIL